jgi:hypothetical protein
LFFAHKKEEYLISQKERGERIGGKKEKWWWGCCFFVVVAVGGGGLSLHVSLSLSSLLSPLSSTPGPKVINRN